MLLYVLFLKQVFSVADKTTYRDDIDIYNVFDVLDLFFKSFHFLD